MSFPKPPATYRFELTITEGADEWWEEVAALPTLAARREEVRQQMIRCLEAYGFFENDVMSIKSLSNPRT